MNRIPYQLLQKYSDLSKEEIDKCIDQEITSNHYETLSVYANRKFHIDPKVYNVNTNRWNLHNIPLEDIHHFVQNNERYLTQSLLDDMHEFSYKLYTEGRLLNVGNVGFTLPNSLRLNHYHDEKDFAMSYQELKTGSKVLTGKPIKILKKLPWVRKIDEKKLVEFNDFLKGKYNSSVVIKEVQGAEIRKWYSGEYYAKDSATLKESCMRHRRCANYFDIYTENTGVRMIIALKDNMLAGRAIIWDRDLWNKNYFDNASAIVDRIYGNEGTIEQIKQYCMKQNYVHKARQSYQEPDTWVHYVDGYGHIKDRKIRLNLDTNYDQYPYMDTFKFCNLSNDYIANFSDIDYDFELTCTDGYNRNESCHDCSGDIDDDDIREIDGNSYCCNCTTYVEYDDCYYLNDDTVYSEADGLYYHVDNALETLDDDWIHEDDAAKSFDGNWVLERDAIVSYESNGNTIYVTDCGDSVTFNIGTSEYTFDTRMSETSMIKFINYVLKEHHDEIDAAKQGLTEYIISNDLTFENIFDKSVINLEIQNYTDHEL